MQRKQRQEKLERSTSTGSGRTSEPRAGRYSAGTCTHSGLTRQAGVAAHPGTADRRRARGRGRARGQRRRGRVVREPRWKQEGCPVSAGAECLLPDPCPTRTELQL